MIAVFNSSPLIFLSGIDIIDKALDLFSEVFVPSQVQAEIMAKEDVAWEKLASLTASKRVIIVQAKNTRMVDAICRRLGKGESEAIVAAIEVTADMVALDDRAARIEAMSLGLNVKGTLGIIKKLMDIGIAEYELERLYQELSALSFRVSRTIFDEIFSE